MDKIISARIDESAADRIGSLARRLRTSKKKVIERAIEVYAAQVDQEQEFDVFEQTSGAWSRKESAAQLVATARKTFRNSMPRHPR
jgi:predicted transcriptional regulator